METRGATAAAGRDIQNLIRQGGLAGASRALSGDASRAAMEAVMGMFGFDPTELGLGAVVESSLTDPADQTAGLFASLRPFEQRATETAVRGQRSLYGTMGARFSRRASEGEAMLRGELANQFAKARQEALLTANSQRNAALATVLNAVTGAGQASLQSQDNALRSILSFVAPGAPYYQQGAFGELVGSIGNIIAARANMGGGGANG